MHFVIAIISVALITYGVFNATTGTSSLLICSHVHCELVRQPLISWLSSKEPLVERTWPRTASSTLKPDIKLARGRGVQVATLSRLNLDGIPLSGFVSGSVNLHQAAASRFMHLDRPPVSITIDGRFKALLGAALLILLGVATFGVAVLIESLGIVQQVGTKTKQKAE